MGVKGSFRNDSTVGLTVLADMPAESVPSLPVDPATVSAERKYRYSPPKRRDDRSKMECLRATMQHVKLKA